MGAHVSGMPFRLDIVELASSGLSPARLRTGRQLASIPGQVIELRFRAVR